jgi:membrane protease YdiL (CAAX protease family)
MDSNYDDLPTQPSELAPVEVIVEVIEPLPPQPSTAQRIFKGPFGLRAGWGLLIYIAIIASIVLGINLVGKHYRATHKPPAVAAAKSASNSAAAPKAPAPNAGKPQPMSGMIIGESVVFVVLFLVSLLMATIEKRKLSAFGLGGSRPIPRFVIGAFWGLIAQSTEIAILYFRHLLIFDARLDHGIAILGWGALQLFAFFLVGLVEEYLFRGYLQYTLTRGMVGLGKLISAENSRTIAFWIAAVITSVIFFFAHTGNPGENKIGLFQVFFAGILLLVALWRTGSLWWAIGFHMTWDWAQSFLYGVPDSGGLMQGRLFATHAVGNPHFSGGTAGPEGSIFGIPVLMVIIVIIFFQAPSPQPPLETQSLPLPEAFLLTETVILVEPPTSTI